jgi:hypothetical protein
MTASLQGRSDEARRILRELFDRKPQLAEWMSRMITTGYIPPDAILLDMIERTRFPRSQ